MDAKHISLMFIARLALSAAILWLVYRYVGMIPFILAIPIACALLAKPILEAASSWFGWARKQPYEEWQGRYYEFANTQIRMFEVNNELWAQDSDLLRVIGEKPTLMLGSLYAADYAPIPGTRFHGFSPTPAGTEKVLKASSHHEAARMLMWLQREVYKVHHPRREMAAQGVIKPY
jgi:hypothetical protein